MFLLLVFLHLAFMFTAVSLSYGSQILMLFAIRSNRSENIRSVIGATMLVGTSVPVLFVVGGIFGLLAAWIGGYALLAPWLVIAYVAFAILAFSGVRLTGPNYDHLRATIADSESDRFPRRRRQSPTASRSVARWCSTSPCPASSCSTWCSSRSADRP